MKNPFTSFFDGMLDRVFSVLGAISFAQFPQFVQQYLQRLAGHADEARRIVERYKLAAERAGMEFEPYIERFRQDSDPVIAEHGSIMVEAVERLEFLTQAVAALQQSNMFTRPFVFLANLDTDIGWQAWLIFQPGVPTTVEGAVYALAGIAVGLLVYHALKWPVYKLRSARKGKHDG